MSVLELKLIYPFSHLTTANDRQPSEKNPENYAWAALAVYLARNGAKKDYSTGVLLDITVPSGKKRPHSPNGENEKRAILGGNRVLRFFGA